MTKQTFDYIALVWSIITVIYSVAVMAHFSSVSVFTPPTKKENIFTHVYSGVIVIQSIIIICSFFCFK